MSKSTIELSLTENTNICCIHFSARNRSVGNYDRYPVPDGVANIYVNACDKSWYINGLTSLGDTLEDSIAYFKDLIIKNGYSQVVCIGSSMGAFGAALFAAKLDAECICFGPELEINVFSGYSFQDNVTTDFDFNLQQPSRALLVAGLSSPSDILTSLYYVDTWGNTEVIALNNCGHETARCFKRLGMLTSLIKNFINSKNLNEFKSSSIEELKKKNKIVIPEKIGIIEIEHFYETVREQLSSHQKLKTAELLIGRYIYGLASKIIENFLEEHGPFAEAMFLKAKLLRRTGKFDEALVILKELEYNPEYKQQALWLQSMIHVRLNNNIEAQNLYKYIINDSTKAPVVKAAIRLQNESKKAEIIEAPCNYLLLTTFPAHKSRNVGDSMIAYSANKMLTSRNSSFKTFTLFREENLDKYKDGSITQIIAPGFSVSNDVYPDLFALYSDLKRLPDFFPMGCSFQHPIPALSSFEEYQYSKDTIRFLKFITDRSGPLPCRDQLIVNLLHRYDIPSVYCGDLVLYDDEKVYTEFIPPKEINSIVFTIQHSERYKKQSFKLLELINDYFPNTKKVVAFHSDANPYSKEIAAYATGLGFTELHLYGDADNLKAYDNMDLHIGYRLHGHISFLRRRKPSILMVEDARAYGFAKTKGTDVGCIEALCLKTMEADMEASANAMKFLENQTKANFSDYNNVFDFIDKTYSEFIDPYFSDLAKRI